MSSRVIKKLGLMEKDVIQEDEDSDKDDTLSSFDKPISTFNRYNLLNDESLSESEVKEDDDRTTEPMYNEEDTCDVKVDRRRRKKKKKKKTKTTHNARSSEDNYEDEICQSTGDGITKCDELQVIPPVSEDKENVLFRERLKLLHVQPQNLNPNNELKWIFGSKVVHGSMEYGSKPRRGRVHRLLKTMLSTPRDNWMPYKKTGLTMSLVGSVFGIHYFKYEYSGEYSSIDDSLRRFIAASDLDSVLVLVNLHPYHVNVLLQIAYICNSGDDYALGSELLDRALYSLEHSFHPSFNILNAHCRLDYSCKENRVLFSALFGYMLSAAKRSCYKTAWEINKALLALDLDGDPTACILIIDYYAIKAREYKWLLSFIEAFGASRRLLQLPSYLYSKAIAHFYLKQTEEANEQLVDAMLQFPFVITQFLTKYSGRLDQKILSHKFFSEYTNASEPKSVVVLINLYLERMEQVMKDVSMKTWLESCAFRAIDIINQGVDPRPKEYQRLRYRRYPKTLPINIKRHLVLSSLRELYFIERTDLIYDPVPPPGPGASRTACTRGGETVSSVTNNVGMFFRTILPGFTEPPVIRDIPPDTSNNNNANGNDRTNVVRHTPNPAVTDNAAVAARNDNNNQNNTDSNQLIERPAYNFPREWEQSVMVLIDSVRALLTSLDVFDGNQAGDQEATEADDSATNDNSSS